MESDLVTNLQNLVRDKDTQLQALQTHLNELKSESNKHAQEFEAANQNKDHEIEALHAKLEALTKKLEDCQNEPVCIASPLDTGKCAADGSDEALKDSKRRVVDLEKDNEGLENEIRNVQFERDMLREKVQKLEELSILEKECISEQSNTAQSGQVEKLEETIVHYREEVAMLNGALEIKDTVIRTFESQVQRMQNELESVNERLRQKELEDIDEESELERTKHEIQNLRETLEETDKQIQELNNKLNVSHDWSSHMNDSHLEKLDTYTSAKDLEALKKTLKEMGTEIGILSEKIKHEKDNNVRLMRDNERNARDSKAKEKKIAAHKNEITELRNSLVAERSKNADLEKKLTKMTRDMEDKNKKLLKPTSKDPIRRVNETEKRLSKSPEKQGRDSRASLLSSEDANGSQLGDRLDTDNGLLSDRLNKMLKDVEVLSSRMGTLQEEKAKLEEEVVEREQVIRSLESRCQENSEMMVLVKGLEQENQVLVNRLENILDDVQLLTDRMTSIQSDKQKLETEITHRDSVIDELSQKFQESRDLVPVVRDLEDENGQLNDKLEKMSGDVQMLSNKFITLHDEKIKLESAATQRENIIDGLLQKYQDLEKSLQTYRSRENASTEVNSPLQSPFKEKDDSLHNTPVETDDTFGTMNPMASIDEQYFSNRATKSFIGTKSKMSHTKQLTSSCGPGEVGDYSTQKSELTNKNTRPASPERQVAMEVPVSRYLYVKGLKGIQSSYIRLENDSVYYSENSSRSTKSSSKYLAKGDKTIPFEKIFQKSSELDLKMFNLTEENILGRNLFFLIYGTKKTEKKALKHKFIYEIVETFKSISQKNVDKACRLVIRVQDDKFLKKLEIAKNSTALELFKQHYEFNLRQEEKEKSVDYFITQMKQLDIQLQIPPRSNVQVEKTAPREIYIEFMMHNKSEKGEGVNEENQPGQTIRTKIMLTTTNNVKDEKELEEAGSIEALVDSVLTINKDGQREEYGEMQRRRLSSSIEKFFVMSIAPSVQIYKNVANTLSFAAKLTSFNKIAELPRNVSERRISHSISSPPINKPNECSEARVTPTKRDKLTMLIETPKGNKKANLFQGLVGVRTPALKVLEAKEQPTQHQNKSSEANSAIPSNRRLQKSESFTKRGYKDAAKAVEKDESSRASPQ